MTLDEIDQKLRAADAAISSASQPPAPGTAAGGSWWSVTNAMTMSAAVLVFGVFVMLLATYLIKHGKPPEAILRIFGTILIVMFAVFLVVAGYNDTQVAPVMGLLGTIVGYLLGKETRAAPPEPPRP